MRSVVPTAKKFNRRRAWGVQAPQARFRTAIPDEKYCDTAAVPRDL